jgi:hypothetical protein
MTYTFRREDTGEVIEVDFETMMQQDMAGFIHLELDGQQVTARRVRVIDDKGREVRTPPLAIACPVVSDALGCIDSQVDELREQAKLHGFTGVEWKSDPHEPGFYQAHFSSVAERDRYASKMLMRDQGKRNGSAAMLSRHDLERAKEIAKRKV